MSYRVSEPKGVLTVASAGEGQTGFILQGVNVTGTGLTTTATKTLSGFSASDVNKTIQIVGAGTGGADFFTTIATVTNSSTIVLGASAPTSVTNKSAFWYPVGQDDTAAIQAAINATTDSESTVYLPAGVFVISSTLSSAPYLKKFMGDGFNQTYVVVSSLAFTGDMLAFNSVGRGLDVSDIGFKHAGLATSTTSATITAYSITSNVITLTATNSYTVGQAVALSGFQSLSSLNDTFATVLASGLSGSQFKINFTHADASGSDTGVAHLDYNCLSFSVVSTNTLIYANIDRVQMMNAPGDGLKMASSVVSKVTQCVALSNNGHGFSIYNAANVGATSTTFDTCYANGNQQAGYYLHSVVYAALTSCAADSNGISYYLYANKAMTLNGCGSEASLNKNAAFPGYHFYVHGGQGNILNSCYTSSNSGIANTAGTFLVFDNTAGQCSANNIVFAGTVNLPTNAFTIASGCTDITVYEPYFSTIANTAWTDAGTNSTIYFDANYQTQLGLVNDIMWTSGAITPTINQSSIAATGQQMLIQAQSTTADGYIGGELRLRGGDAFAGGTTSRGGDVTIKGGATAPGASTVADGYINFNFGALGNFARWTNAGPASSQVALEFINGQVTNPEIRIQATTSASGTGLNIRGQNALTTGGSLNLFGGTGSTTGGLITFRPGYATNTNTTNTVRFLDGYTGNNAFECTPSSAGTSSVAFVSTVTGINYQQTATTTGNGARTMMVAQSTSNPSSTAGVMNVRGGSATGASGTGASLLLDSGGGVTANGVISLRTDTSPTTGTSFTTFITFTGTNGPNPSGSVDMNWVNTITVPRILQATASTGDGYTFIIQAQNTSSGTGGALSLTSGTGTVAAGNLNLQTGGTTKIAVNPTFTTFNDSVEAFRITPTSSGTTTLQFASSVTTATITQSSTSTAINAAPLSITAQTTTLISATTNGGQLNMTAGSATGAGGTLNTGGGVNIRAGSASGNTTANQGGNLTLRAGDGSGTGAANGSVRIVDPINGNNVIQFTANVTGTTSIALVSTVTAFNFNQSSTAIAAGANWSINAQNTTGDGYSAGAMSVLAGNATGAATANGGALILSAGSSTNSSNGSISFRAGGNNTMQINPNNPSGQSTLLFAAGVTDARFVFATNTTASGNQLTIQAQNSQVTSGDGYSGGNLRLTAGAASGSATTSTGGSVFIDAATGSPGTNGNIQMRIGTTPVFTFNPVSAGVSSIQLANTATAFNLNQADKTTNASTGATFTIQAQNETGTTSTGGALTLTSGTGTTAAGSVNIQAGGVNKLVVAASGQAAFSDTATALTIVPVSAGISSLTVSSTVTRFDITQSATSTASAAQMSVKAQNTSFNTGSAGDLTLGSGAGTASTTNGGNLILGAGVGTGGINGLIKLTNKDTSGNFNTAINITPNPTGASLITAVAGVTALTINQDDKGTNAGTGATFTLQAQNETGTTSTGGQLALTSGTGTTVNGNVVLQSGGTTVMTLGGSGLQFATTSVAIGAGGTITLAATNYKFGYIILTGNLTATSNVTLVFPATSGAKWIVDATAVTLGGKTITLQANGANWATTVGVTNIYSITYGGTGKLYGTLLTP